MIDRGERINIKSLIIEPSLHKLETVESLIGLSEINWEDMKKHHTDSLSPVDIFDNTNYPLKNWLTKLKIKTLYPNRSHEIVISKKDLIRIKEDRKRSIKDNVSKDRGSYVGYSLILSSFGKIDFDADLALKGLTDSDYKNLFDSYDKFWQVDLGVAAIKLLRPDVTLNISKDDMDKKIEETKKKQINSSLYSTDLAEMLAAKKILFPKTSGGIDKNIWKTFVGQLKILKDKKYSWIGFINLAFYMKIIESDEIRIGKNGLEIIKNPNPKLPDFSEMPEMRRY